MFKKTIALLLAAAMACSLAACGTSSQGESTSQAETEAASESAATQETEATSETGSGQEDVSSDAASEAVKEAVAVPNTLAEDRDSLIANYADKFEQKTYTDSDSGLSITYNIYLPEGYDASGSYPMVVFIADSSCVGDDAAVSLTQGRGALAWVTEEWQSEYPTIVAVPTYPETILDDHDGYTTTEYVELTKRFIDYMSSEYAVDTNRIYGTGQSMGCMTTLILASEYPDLYAACMFVDGQWDVSTLKGLEDQAFVYFAAEDDTSAWNGAQEVMEMFDADSAPYKYAQWDGNWSVDELSKAAKELFTEDADQYFISWATGTIEPKNGGMGGSGAPGGGFGGPGGSGNSAEKPPKGFGDRNDGTSSGNDSGMSGGMGGASYHMASFDYAYNCVAVMEWLFGHRR